MVLIPPACPHPHQKKRYPGSPVCKCSWQLQKPSHTLALAYQVIFLYFNCLLIPSWQRGSNHHLSMCGKMKLQQPYRTVLSGQTCKTSEILIKTSVLRYTHLQWHHISANVYTYNTISLNTAATRQSKEHWLKPMVQAIMWMQLWHAGQVQTPHGNGITRWQCPNAGQCATPHSKNCSGMAQEIKHKPHSVDPASSFCRS